MSVFCSETPAGWPRRRQTDMERGAERHDNLMRRVESSSSKGAVQCARRSRQVTLQKRTGSRNIPGRKGTGCRRQGRRRRCRRQEAVVETGSSAGDSWTVEHRGGRLGGAGRRRVRQAVWRVEAGVVVVVGVSTAWVRHCGRRWLREGGVGACFSSGCSRSCP